ncbi:MAG: nitroreductase family protein [Acidimicrobiales bacterium]
MGLDMPLKDAMSTQRAVRRLRTDPVDDDVILRCLALALKAPTGSNGQNWEFVIVRDPEIKAKLGRQYKRAWRLYGAIGRRLRTDEATRRILLSVQWQVDHFEELPVLVVCCLRGARVPLLPQPSIMTSTYFGSIYPSVQNLLLAARAEGLGASLITLPLWSTTVARRALDLPLNVLPCCIVPIGWPKGHYGPTKRKPVGTVVHVDRYGNQPFRS